MRKAIGRWRLPTATEVLPTAATVTVCRCAPRGGWGHGGASVSSSNFIYFNMEYGYNLYIATPNTPEFAQSMIARLTADFINILFKAVDAAAQQ